MKVKKKNSAELNLLTSKEIVDEKINKISTYISNTTCIFLNNFFFVIFSLFYVQN